MNAEHAARMLHHQREQLDRAAAAVDLDALGAMSGAECVLSARWLNETPEVFCLRTAQALRYVYGENHRRGCPWSTRAIQQALLKRMEAK